MQQEAWPYCGILIVACLCGCAEPTTKQPLGTLLEQQQLKPLQGVWRSSEGETMQVEHTGNNFVLGYLEFDSTAGKFTAVNTDCVITKVEDFTLIFFKHLAKDDEYYFSQVMELTNDHIVLRKPSAELFNNGIKARKLGGDLLVRSFRGKDYEYARVDVDEASFLKFIKAEGAQRCFPKSGELRYQKVR
jgi:hypothetical protein